MKLSKKIYLWINLSPLFLSALLALIILFLFKYLPPKLPLFYSLPWGEKMLASSNQFLIIPLALSLITLLNLSLSYQLHPSQSFFKKALLVSSFVTGLILTITFVKIIFIYI